ncbi:MAG: LamG-like jellyroll fold domain-containing protein [Nanoarchaeota archaeon]
MNLRKMALICLIILTLILISACEGDLAGKAFDTSDSDLIAYYSFDSGPGDDSGNDHGGTVTGATPTTEGKSGSAYRFDGSDSGGSRITIPPSSSFDSIKTVSLWFKLEGTNVYGGLMTRHNSNSDRWGILGRYQGQNTPSIFHYKNTYVFNGVDQANSIGVDNEFHHFLVTFDGTNTRLYLDGDLQTSSISYNLFNYAIGKGLEIGAYRYNTAPANSFKGIIDEVGLWDKPFTASEVIELYNSYSGESVTCTPSCPAASTVTCGQQISDPTCEGCTGTGDLCPAGEECQSGGCVTVLVCDDGICNGDETCATCVTDCACETGKICQNGACVTCTPSCPLASVVSCGTTDTRANGCGENCNIVGNKCVTGTCVTGQCIYCGDGTCNGAETSVTCIADCACTPDCSDVLSYCAGVTFDDANNCETDNCVGTKTCIAGLMCNSSKYPAECDLCIADCGAASTYCDGEKFDDARGCGTDNCVGTHTCLPTQTCQSGACIDIPATCGDGDCDETTEDCTSCESDCACVVGKECVDGACSEPVVNEQEFLAPIDCDTCSYNGLCLPFGYRVDNMYCDAKTKNMLGQRSTLAECTESGDPDCISDCQNDFECVTNVCSAGSCVDLQAKIEESTGFLGRIWCKITNLFSQQGYECCITPSLPECQ